jgi:hypothetical protein
MPMSPSLKCALLALLHTALLSGLTAGARAPRALGRSNHCQLDSWTYHPSKLEMLWRANINVWAENDYCAEVAKWQDNITYWLNTTAKLMLTERQHLHSAGSPPDDVFSAFLKTYICSGVSHTRTSWIEPLAFALRHPNGPCDPRKTVARDYMLLDSRVDVALSFVGPGSPKFYMFDLGASTWAAGYGGPSQSFLVDAYKKRGIIFDRILLWEATPHAPADVYDNVPRYLHASYQYINIPVSAERGDPGNPLEIIKQITDPSDFVALKLDIDTHLIENQLMQQILEDSEIYSRIDEFYFEQHVNFQPMLSNWKKSADPNLTMASSYDLFVELRNRGIRAHGWP